MKYNFDEYKSRYNFIYSVITLIYIYCHLGSDPKLVKDGSMKTSASKLSSSQKTKRIMGGTRKVPDDQTESIAM